jgi:MFS family permease
MALIMLGNGLQGSLLGVRASIENFDITTTGVIMSGYFVGLIIGASVVPKIVGRVGHIRSFAALASLASTSILVHVVFIDPWVWWAMRVATGFAYAGIYIVAESWLNDAADNETRGQLLSFYILISLGGMAGGQFMLNIASPDGFELFVLISVLISIAVIPILISVGKAPSFEATESISLMQLYRVSPLGVVGILVCGISMGAIFGMGAVYATNIGLSVSEVSYFMASLIVGGIIVQYPVGRLSDTLGRRKVIIATCLLGAIVSFAAATGPIGGWRMYALIALVGGFSFPLYSLCIAHTNDYLSPSQMVAASGTLVLANGVGASLGAPITALAMENLGPSAFYQTNGAALAIVSLYALWRVTRRDAVSTEDAGDFVVMAPTPMSAVMNPDLELEEIEASWDSDIDEVRAELEELVDELSSPDEDA